jgi:hypothetical protein
MALLPLAFRPAAGLAGSMSSTVLRSPVTSWARRAAKAVADLVHEYDYAQRRLLELRLFGRDHECAPDTYAEFLHRSPLTLWREPSARRRKAGAQPR